MKRGSSSHLLRNEWTLASDELVMSRQILLLSHHAKKPRDSGHSRTDGTVFGHHNTTCRIDLFSTAFGGVGVQFVCFWPCLLTLGRIPLGKASDGIFDTLLNLCISSILGFVLLGNLDCMDRPGRRFEKGIGEGNYREARGV